MFGVKSSGKPVLEKQTQYTLSEYITAVAWSSQGILAAATASGELVLWENQIITTLLPNTDQSLDCLEFSADGQYLAAAGQEGKVRIWHLSAQPQLILTLDHNPQWIDQLSWCPGSHLLAFNLGRYVQIWDISSQQLVTTLLFENSSVLGLSWQPQGKHLAVCGNLGVKIWDSDDWNEDPYLWQLAATGSVIAWSTDGQYLACACLDCTISVLEWNQAEKPWVMQGFPGKIRHLAWSESINGNTPLLASSSVQGIVIWKKNAKRSEGFSPRVLERHQGKVEGIAFQPQSLLLASVGEDGFLCLWQQSKKTTTSIASGKNCFLLSGLAPKRSSTSNRGPQW